MNQDADLPELPDDEDDGLPQPAAAARPLSVAITVAPPSQGVRLDQFIASAFPGYSRSLIQRSIEAGLALINGQPAKPSYRIRAGDQLRMAPLEPPAPDITPEDIPLDILYEDEFLAVVNKPPGMVVHPARGNWGGTLVNALRFHFDQLSAAGGDYRPGIVHRLDRDTSGVILIAKEESTHRDLSMAFESRTVFKEYLCLCQGVLDRDSDYIEKAIGRHPTVREKMAVFPAPNEAKRIREAVTYYEAIERFDGFTYCRAHPKTGRTHQIRVHLASVGCPILADELYLGQKEFRLAHVLPGLPAGQDAVLLERQALHAHRLKIQHPKTEQWIEFEAPLPAEIERTLEALRAYRPYRGGRSRT